MSKSKSITTNMFYKVNLVKDETNTFAIVSGYKQNAKQGVARTQLTSTEVDSLNKWLYGLSDLSLFERTESDIKYRKAHDMPLDDNITDGLTKFNGDGDIVSNVTKIDIFAHISTPAKDGYLLRGTYFSKLNQVELYVESNESYDSRRNQRASTVVNTKAQEEQLV